MKNSISSLLVLFLLCPLVFSCNNDEEDEFPASVYLIGEGWELQEYTVSPPLEIGFEPRSDLYQFQAPCMRDDQFIFNVDKSLIYYDGDNLCDSPDNQTREGTWELRGDNNVLIIRFDQGEIKWTINSISENRLSINEAPLILDSITYTYTRVYKR